MSNKLDEIQWEVERLQSSKRVCQVYIRMKESERELNHLQDSLKHIEKINVAKTLTFVPNDDLKRFLHANDVLGKFYWADKGEKLHITANVNVPRTMVATWITDIYLRTDKDNNTCCITGSAILIDNRMILADYRNNKVKLVDTRFNSLISEMKLQTQPWDIAAIKNNTVAVTLPNSRKIRLLNVVDTIDREREIGVGGECYGLACTQEMLVVTFVDNPRIELIDLLGNTVRRIKTDGLFTRPEYVCISDDGDALYVSDYARHTVTSLTFAGEVTAVYTDRELRGPEKVCTDHSGYVYVCGYSSRNVHVIASDTKKVKVILTQADGLESSVYSISHCQDTDFLYVGLGWSNNIKVYKLR